MSEFLQAVLKGNWDESQHPRGKTTPESTPGSFASVTSTPEFKAWFGQSKVVDKQGKPLRLYHHTYRDFNVLRPGGYDPRLSGKAIWLTEEPDVRYAAMGHQHAYAVADLGVSWIGNAGGGGGIATGARSIPVYVKMLNPKRAKSINEVVLLLPEDIERLKSQGYDGIIYAKRGKIHEAAVFRPSQVKSAFNSRPTNKPHLMKEESWLSVAKEAVWNEADHPRGKTTPESNAGSFTAAHKEISLEQFKTMRGEITLEKPVYNEDEQQDDIEEVYVLMNPTGEEILRWFGRDAEEFRYIRFKNGTSLWWDADNARHRTVMRLMQGLGYKFTWEEDVSSFGETTPQLLRQDLMRKSWLAIAKDYVWNEAYHHRGKTTPESNSGSFAPMPSGPQTLTIESYEHKRPGVKKQSKLDVIFNPTKAELKRWAGRELSYVRWIQWGNNTVFWNSYEALHQQVGKALVKQRRVAENAFRNAYWESFAQVNGPGVRTGDTELSDLLGNQWDELFPEEVRKTEVHMSALRDWLRVIKEAVWREEDHPRGKTVPGTNSGSFASAATVTVPVRLWGEPWREAKQIEVLRNPSPEQLARWAGREIVVLRVLIAEQTGDQYFWDAEAAMHDTLLEGLQHAGLLAEGAAVIGDAGMTTSILRKLRNGRLAKSWLRLIKDAAGWKEEEHPRGKTTPESTPGSFAPKEIPGQNPNMGGAGMVIVAPNATIPEQYAGAMKNAAQQRRYIEADRQLLQQWRDAAAVAHERFLNALASLNEKLDLTGPVFENEAFLRNYDDIRSTVPALKELYGWQVETVLSDSALSYRSDPRFEEAFDAMFTELHSLSNALGMEVSTEDTIATNLRSAVEYEQEAETLKAQLDLVQSPAIEQESIEALKQTLPNMSAQEESEAAQELRRNHAYGDEKLEKDDPVAAAALNRYIGPGYDEINDQFRGGGDPLTSDSPGSMIKQHSSYTAVYEAAYKNYVDETLYSEVSLVTHQMLEEAHRENKHLDVQFSISRKYVEFADSVKEEATKRALEVIKPKAEEAAFLRAHAILANGPDESGETLRRQIIAWKDAREIVRLIDSRPPTPEPMVLHRGVKSGKSIKLAELKPGDEFVTAGFYSTSANAKVAGGWSGANGKVLEIHVPKGSRDVLFTTNDGEAEVILNHGVRLEFIGTRLRLENATKLRITYVFTFLGQDKDTGRVAKKAGGAKYRVNFGRFQTEPTIVATLRKWEEEDHPRGKTTPESTSGSFAPADRGPGRMISNMLGNGSRTMRVRGQRVAVLINPTGPELERWASEMLAVRGFQVGRDFIFWDAEEGRHKWMEGNLRLLGILDKEQTTNRIFDDEMPIESIAEYLEWHRRAQGTNPRVTKSWLQLIKEVVWREEEHPRGETTEGTNKGSFRPQNMGFVSPNIDENVDFQEAANRVTSHRTKLLLQADEEIAERYGTHTHESVGVGAWADGAEQSIIVDGSGSFEAFKAHMALSGLLAEQKAVIAFTNDANGPDSVYRLSVGNRPLKEVHSALLEAGVQFHTLRKTDHNVDVFVFAPGTEQELQNAVAKAAERFGVDEVDFVRGYGEFIGSWDSREEGRRAYEALLDAYESQVPRHDGGWKKLRDKWRSKFGAVRKHQEAQALTDADLRAGGGPVPVRPGDWRAAVVRFALRKREGGFGGGDARQQRVSVCEGGRSSASGAPDRVAADDWGVADDDRPHQPGPGGQPLGEPARSELLDKQPQPDLPGRDVRPLAGAVEGADPVRPEAGKSGEISDRKFGQSCIRYDEGQVSAVRKSWLEEILKWDESQHPRGKTTPESTPGSFIARTWASHAEGIASLVEGAAGLTAADVKAGKYPLLRYEPKIAGTEHIVGQFTLTPDQPDPGYVKLSDAFFADSDALGRQLLLSHEFGHAIPAYLSQTNRWNEAFAVLAPFKSGGSGVYTRFDNFAGLSSNPEEMLADVYSSMLIYKKQPWEDEGRHADVYRYVLRLAGELGLPLPKWYVKKSWLRNLREAAADRPHR